MVMYIPQRGQEETGGQEPSQLEDQSRPVLLQIAVELDPDVVAEAYEEGWSRQDLIAFIKKHAQAAVGNQGIEGWEFIQDVEVEGENEE